MKKKLIGLLLGLTILNGGNAFADTKVDTRADDIKAKIDVSIKDIKRIEDTRNRVVDIATQYDGWEYVWGGSSPKTSFDCSGLIQYAYKQVGYDIARVSYLQAKEGIEVDIKDIQKGDIICMVTTNRNNGDVTHVAMYIGNDKMFHARSSRFGIRYDEYSEAWKDKTVTIRRVIK